MRKLIISGAVLSFLLLTGSAQAAAVLELSAPASATVTVSALVPSVGGVPASNSAVDAAVANITPLSVNLKNTGDTASDAVRIAPVSAGNHVQFWAKDSSSNWYDINVVGWMPSSGIAFPASYDGSTDVYAISDIVGDYPVTINLVQASNPSNVLATFSGSVNVTGVASVANEASLRSAISNSLVSTIEFSNNINVASQVTVNRPVTIDGKGFTLSPTFTKGDSSNNSALGIQANDVTVKNLVVDGTSGKNLHGINIYTSTGVLLDNVTSSNNDSSGINVNGSEVTVNKVTTSGNGWNGIDVDLGSGVSSPAILTVNGRSSHSESEQIKIDDIRKSVNVVDSLSQYSQVLTGNTRVYTLVTGNPVITLNGDATMTVAFGSNFEDPGATAVDSRGNTVDVAITGSVDTRNPGDYTLTYSATDSLDNSAQLTRTVTVSAPPARSSSGRRGGGGGGTAVSLPAQASPVAVAATGEVLGAFTDAETQAQIVIVKQQIAGLIQQLIAMLQAQLAAAIAAQ